MALTCRIYKLEICFALTTLVPEGVVTGSARAAQEAREQQQELLALHNIEKRRALAERKKRALEAQILAIQVEIDFEEAEAIAAENEEILRIQRNRMDREAMERSRSKAEGLSVHLKETTI